MPVTTPQPITLSGASIVIQVFLLLISFVALWLLSRSYPARDAAKDSYSILIVWFLIALVLILFAEDLYATWGGILGELTLPTIPKASSFLAVFFLDIVFVTILILRTGGTKQSPFTSVLLLLPSLAIFLREPRERFLLYSIACGLIYAVTLRISLAKSHKFFDRSTYDVQSREDSKAEDWSVLWTNMSCLALATLIGFITAPK
jgi:hypothetical protein